VALRNGGRHRQRHRLRWLFDVACITVHTASVNAKSSTYKRFFGFALMLRHGRGGYARRG
jgi:hypothetical protein